MALNYHHSIEEINGIRCSIVEKGITAQRIAFLKNILESSGYLVQISNNDNAYTIGVTDIIFNPIYALYSRSLKSMDGKVVTPSIWNQKAQTGDYYWDYSK